MHIHLYHPRQRHGIAMILVMIAIAAASVLAYGMLSSASLQNQLSASVATRLQTQYLAESGMNLTLYYLRNPRSSPVSSTFGSFGDTYYPGETNITISGMEGTISSTVTNTAHGKLHVVCTSLYKGQSATLATDVSITKSATMTVAAMLNGSQTITSKTAVTGGLYTNGSLTRQSGGTLSGSVTATNGSTFTGGTSISSQTENAVPGSSSATLLSTMPYYYYNGNRYTAKIMSSNYTGGVLLDTNVTSNPLNVWYHTGGDFSGTTLLAGTLVSSRGGGVNLGGNLTITPLNNMPALVSKGDLTTINSTRTITLNGVVYLGGKLGATGTSTSNKIVINGALVSPSSNVLSGFGGTIQLTYSNTRTTVQQLADSMESVQSMTVSSYEQTNGRPQ